MNHRRIPTWLLERVILDEVPPELADEVREILDESPEERARLAELERSNAEILATLPPARVAAEVARRAESARGYAFLFAFSRRDGGPGMRGRRLLALSSSLAVAAGAVLIAVAVGRGGEQPVARPVILDDPSAGPGETRVKGPPRLRLSRKRDRKEAELLKDNAVVYPGDRIEIEYVASSAIHGLILSIDGRGVVNQHFPARAGGSTLLEHREGGKPSSVGHSIQLDDAPDFERFVLISSKREIDVADMVARVEALASDPQRRVAGTLGLQGDVVLESWHKLKKGAAP